MQPTDILAKFKRFDTEEKIDDFFIQMSNSNNHFNEYLLEKVLKRTSPELVDYVKAMREEYLNLYKTYFTQRKSMYMDDEKRTKTYFEGLSDSEIHAIKQRKFEKSVIIYTPQGGKSRKY